MTANTLYPAIVGPTAVGKTALGLRLAARFKWEIVSVDSRQIYQGMDIGTGKEVHLGSWEERNGRRVLVINNIPIHGLDLARPEQEYSVSHWLKDILPIIDEIESRGVRPLFVGGTGFYFQALTGEIPTINVPQNVELRQELAGATVAQLQQRLLHVDRSKFESLNQSDRSNPVRLVRAIEVADYQGAQPETMRRSPASPRLQPQDADLRHEQRYSLQYIGLTMPRTQLYARADRRTRQMFDQGLIEETRALLQHYSIDLPSMSGIGYREVAGLLNGGLSQSTAMQLIHRRNHSYIRRQLTWWRKQRLVTWVDVSQPEFIKQIDQLLAGTVME